MEANTRSIKESSKNAFKIGFAIAFFLELTIFYN